MRTIMALLMMTVMALTSACASTDYVPKQNGLARLVQDSDDIYVEKDGQRRALKDNIGTMLQCSKLAQDTGQSGSKLIRDGQDMVLAGDIMSYTVIAWPLSPVFWALGKRDINQGIRQVVDAINQHNDDSSCWGGN